MPRLGQVEPLSTRRGDVHVRFANEREDFIPETSFGAEVVPEGQRPVNEYLEMRRSPLFEWASNEVGTKGVSWIHGGVPNNDSVQHVSSKNPCKKLNLCLYSF